MRIDTFDSVSDFFIIATRSIGGSNIGKLVVGDTYSAQSVAASVDTAAYVREIEYTQINDNSQSDIIFIESEAILTEVARQIQDVLSINEDLNFASGINISVLDGIIFIESTSKESGLRLQDVATIVDIIEAKIPYYWHYDIRIT